MEELGSHGWGLSQREMEAAPAREMSREVRVGSCHPCAAGRPGTDRLEKEEEEGEEEAEEEEEAAKGRGLGGQGIYDHRH